MIDQDIIDRVQARVNETIDNFAKAGFAKINITFKIVSFTGKYKNYAGIVWHGATSEFEISKEFLEQHTDEVIKTTVPHEISHLYARKYYPLAKQAHGPEFRYLMSVLGLKGDTYHTMKRNDLVKPERKPKTIAAPKVVNPDRKPRVTYMYIYLNTNNQRCRLTSMQHNAMKANPKAHTFKGLPLIFSGERVIK